MLNEASETSRSKRKRKLQASFSSGSNLSEQSSAQSVQQVTSTDIYRSLQEVIAQNFGLVGASTVVDVQVRMYDPKVRVAIIKTTRDKYPIVRSSLTFITHIKQLKLVASTIYVSGSARTARYSAFGEMQKYFYGQDLGSLGLKKGEPWPKKSRIAMEKDLQELEERLDKIDSAC